MKAKVIETGKTVEVVDKRYPMSGNLYYEDIDTKKHYGADELKPLREIDWEQRRFELAKAALQGMATLRVWNDENDLADWSLKIADAVIMKLKNE